MQAYEEVPYAEFGDTLDDTLTKPITSSCIICAIPFLSYESNYVKIRMNETSQPLLEKYTIEPLDLVYETIAKKHKCDVEKCIRNKTAKEITENVCSADECMIELLGRIFKAHDEEQCKIFEPWWES